MAEDLQERTEEPSGKRREDARQKGQVARSRELNSALVMIAAALVFLATGGYLANGMVRIATNGLQLDRATIMDETLLLHHLMAAVIDALLLLTPFMIVMLLVALLAPMALGGMVFSFDQLRPKLSKLDPIKGLGRIFSTRGLAELVKALLKFLLVGSIATLWIYHEAESIVALGYQPVEAALGQLGSSAAWALLVFCSGMIVISIIDVPLQLWEHTRQLRMTRQEQKEEAKQMEGDPHLRSRIRQLQRERAGRRMMSDVPTADVIVMNPNHYAVALRYRPDNSNAPVVVAKGMNLIALQIRDVAMEHDVPVVQSPPLARTLYYHAEIGREIPAGLYMAVAQLLAYVYQLRGDGVSPKYTASQVPDFPIPDELKRDI